MYFGRIRYSEIDNVLQRSATLRLTYWLKIKHFCWKNVALRLIHYPEIDHLQQQKLKTRYFENLPFATKTRNFEA